MTRAPISHKMRLVLRRIVEEGEFRTFASPTYDALERRGLIEWRPDGIKRVYTATEAGRRELTRLYAFRRRRTVEQIVYVRAESPGEAERRARAEDVEDTGDEVTTSLSYGRVPEYDH